MIPVHLFEPYFFYSYPGRAGVSVDNKKKKKKKKKKKQNKQTNYVIICIDNIFF